MHYGKFPRYCRWLEFESPDDFEKYQRQSRKRSALWQSDFEESLTKFRALIDAETSEQKIHDFLERHPYLLPGFGDFHHGPYAGIIATKLSLGKEFVTDFAYIASNSQTLQFTCVEIESAKKCLFRADGKFSRDYLDARQQISDWLHWAKQNVREAIDCWGSVFNGRPPKFYDVSFRGYLVFGRRFEIDTPVKQERWSAEAVAFNPNLKTMTYDRLLQRGSRIDVDNTGLAVCSFRERRFFVKRVID